MRKKIIKKIAVIFSVLIAIFLLINLAWLLMIWSPFKDYCENSEELATSYKYTENEMMAYYTYYDTASSYGYKIYKPEYLSFVGLTLAIGDDRHSTAVYDAKTGEISEKDPPLLIFNIVRNAIGHYKYHLTIFDVGGENYDVIIDKNLNIIEAESAEQNSNAQKLINENFEHLTEIMNYAIKMWGLK